MFDTSTLESSVLKEFNDNLDKVVMVTSISGLDKDDQSTEIELDKPLSLQSTSY
jgi:hypothetical protein